MILTLQNKLYEFEMAGKENKVFLLYLAQDILEMVNNVISKGFYYILTKNEKMLIEEIRIYYNNEFLAR